MTLTFPIKTVKDIFVNYKKHSIEDKVEFIVALYKENGKVTLGTKVKTGKSYKIEGDLPQEHTGWGEWIGEIHSHTQMNDNELFVELEKGMSDDDVNHVISGIFKGNYKKFPVLFCVAKPTKDTKDEFWLDVQCEKYQKIEDKDLVGIPRSEKPIVNHFKLFDGQYPASPFDAAHIQQWKQGDGQGKWGYPFPVDVNKWQEELHTTGQIKSEELGIAYKATLFYQADMASIKKGLRNKGLLTSDEFTIKCKKLTIGRQKKSLMVCSYGEQTLNL